MAVVAPSHHEPTVIYGRDSILTCIAHVSIYTFSLCGYHYRGCSYITNMYLSLYIYIHVYIYIYIYYVSFHPYSDTIALWRSNMSMDNPPLSSTLVWPYLVWRVPSKAGLMTLEGIQGGAFLVKSRLSMDNLWTIYG